VDPLAVERRRSRVTLKEDPLAARAERTSQAVTSGPSPAKRARPGGDPATWVRMSLLGSIHTSEETARGERVEDDDALSVYGNGAGTTAKVLELCH
jgi:hypothetical protein